MLRSFTLHQHRLVHHTTLAYIIVHRQSAFGSSLRAQSLPCPTNHTSTTNTLHWTSTNNITSTIPYSIIFLRFVDFRIKTHVARTKHLTLRLQTLRANNGTSETP